MCLYSTICLSSGVIAWESSCFAATVLHHAPLKVTSVLLLFVIFGSLFQLIGNYTGRHSCASFCHFGGLSIAPMFIYFMFTGNPL